MCFCESDIILISYNRACIISFADILISVEATPSEDLFYVETDDGTKQSSAVSPRADTVAT